VIVQDQWNPNSNSLTVENFSGTAFNTRAYLSGGFHKILGDHQLSIGIQPGVIFRYFKNDQATYPEQYDRYSGGFDPANTGGERMSITSPQLLKFDMNVGLEWMADLNYFEAHAGLAAFHLFRPNQSMFSNKDFRLNRLWVMSAGTKHYLSETWTIFPNVIYMYQGQSDKLHLGGGIEKNLGEGDWKHFNLSGYVRASGALIAIAGVGYKNFDFGFSYDAGLNEDIGAFMIDKAFEFSVVYKCNFDPELPSFYIPCNRY
jgi:type IX secretion system PorP/SprF family membrane protein